MSARARRSGAGWLSAIADHANAGVRLPRVLPSAGTATAAVATASAMPRRSCSSVWVAMSVSRSTPWPRGTAG